MGRVVAVDTSILIYLLEEHPRYFQAARGLFERIQSGSCQGIFSIVGMIELLTGAKKKGTRQLAQDYKLLLSHLPHFSIYSIDETIVDVASDLRVRYGLRTPDAIHLATAIAKGARAFVTNDRRLKNVREIQVVAVREIDGLFARS